MKIVHETKKMQRGFTLIELMIVVVIVAILAAIAVPSYKRHIVKTNRSDAMAVLQGFAQAMERYYAQNNTYATAVAGTVFPNRAPLEGVKRYDLTLVSTATTYTITATPVAGGTQAGDGIITLTNTGARGWDRNNDGDTSDSGENTWSDH